MWEHLVVLCACEEMDRLLSKLAILRAHQSHPMMAFALLVFMFSMAGIPPLAGFLGSGSYLAAIEAQLYTLAIIGVISSVVAAFYYLNNKDYVF